MKHYAFSKIWIVIILIIFFAGVFAGGILAYWYLSRSEVKMITDLKIYFNKELGIYFSYPESWGKVEVSRILGRGELSEEFAKEFAGLSPIIKKGTQVILTFNKNYLTSLYFSSPDFQKVIIYPDVREEILPSFTGRKEELVCEPSIFGESKVMGCDSVTIAGSPGVEWYTAKAPTNYCCEYSFYKNFKIISPNQNFPGVEINTRIPGANYTWELLPGEQPDITLEEFANLRMKEGYLPKTSELFLSNLGDLIGSIKFIQ